MSKSFTRQQFYELVWTSPMTHLAKEFVLSDVALHKICRKHGIPTPPLGWWAKKAAGKKVTKTALPKAKAGDAETITIASGELRQEPASIANAREQARIIASETPSDAPVPTSPVVDRTLAKLEKAKANEKGISSVSGDGIIRCDVSEKSFERLKVILPTIIQAASLQGFRLATGQGGAHFVRDEETISFSITEGFKREKHVLTEAEKSQEAAWEIKHQRAIKRNDWDSIFLNRPRFADWDYHPTGILTLEFEQVYVWPGTSPRRSYRDTKNRLLENMAGDIGVGLAVLATSKTEQRLKREAEQRRAEEERKRREELARLKYIEDRRVKELDAILAELGELDRLRRLIGMLSAEMPDENQSRVATFLKWSKEHLAEREADLTREALENRFAHDQIFGDTDGQAFMSRGW